MKRIFYFLIIFMVLALYSQPFFAQTYTIDFLAGGAVPPNGTAPPAVDDIDGSDGQSAHGFSGGQPIELGVKFRVTQGGVITALRFHKGEGNLGTHIGHLWLDNGDNTGTLLATEEFTSETPSGWQEQALSTPVAVVPGNTYVASYYSSTGFYSFSVFYFNPTAVGLPPVIALAYNDPDAGVGNGVYNDAVDLGDGADFPNIYFDDLGGSPGLATNYWADIRFDPFFALPVTLTDFKVSVNNKNVDLVWKTQTEENNKGFEIQRSNNNTDWYSIGFVNGSGNSVGVHTYSFTDKQLAPGRYYYRLNQQDFNGKGKASSTVTATLNGKGTISLFQNVPNPVKGSTAIRFDLPDAQRVRLSVLDITGKEIKVLADKMGQQGSHVINFDVSGLSRQLYIIRLQTETEIITRKMAVE